MKCLGMDLGTKTLGLATSDKLGMISNPYKTIKYTDIDSLCKEVLNIITELKIEVLVLGYPKNMNNTLGEAIERTESFMAKLKEYTNLPIELIDERLSTVEAENILIGADVSRSGREEVKNG